MAAADPVTAIANIGGQLIDRLWPNPAERDAAKLKLFELQQSGELAQMGAAVDLAKGQMAVNAVEAANPNLFVSGWRPNIGWVCGAALAWNYIARPAIVAAATLAGHPVTLPAADAAELMPVLGALLGFGTLRTVEKVKGVG